MTRNEIESIVNPIVHDKGDNYIVSCLGDDGFYLYLDKQDKSLTPSIKQYGYWESWVTAWHTENIKENTWYIDGGANCGYYSMLAYQLGAKVVAFEPNPKYVDLLHETAIINNADIHISHQALSDRIGSTALNFFDDLDGSASIAIATESNLVVSTTTLDRLAWKNQEVVLKLDIEGAEELAFDGGMRFLHDNDVTIIMEYTPGAYSPEFWTKLSKWGSINRVNYAGKEEWISYNLAEQESDWITLTIRKWL